MNKENFDRSRAGIFFGVLILLTGLAVYLVLPFLQPLMWAAVLASLFYPLYVWVLKKVKRTNLSALLTVVLVVLMVLVPVLLLSTLLVREVVNFYSYLSNPNTINSIISFIDNYREHGLIGEVIENLNLADRVRNSLSTIASALLGVVRQGSASTLAFLAKLFLMLYSLFFLLRDGEKLLLKLKSLLPLGDDNEVRLYNRFAATARVTMKDAVLLSLVLGMITGIGLAIVGFPAVVFLTILAAVLSLIPAVGPSMILIPAAVYLFFTAPIWKPIVILVTMVTVALLDNLLRPVLIGGDIEMHPVMFLFSTVGGIVVFGISGVVFGPIIMSLLLVMLNIYEERYKKFVDKKDPPEEIDSEDKAIEGVN